MAQVNTNLNRLSPPIAPGEDYFYFRRSGVTVDNSKVEVIFNGIKDRLIQEIRSSKAILGCVAWLTDFDILNALSLVSDVAICVQKEDFLRPDIGIKDRSQWKEQLRKAYKSLGFSFDRYSAFDIPVSTCSGDQEIQGVRCVGNYNRQKNPAFPRMHNKFIIFGEFKTNKDLPKVQELISRKIEVEMETDTYERYSDFGETFPIDLVDGNKTSAVLQFVDGENTVDLPVFECKTVDYLDHVISTEVLAKQGKLNELQREIDDLYTFADLSYEYKFIPKKVWTGSFNFTQNANLSFENALIIDDEKIAKAFYKEWQHIMLFSEELDWRTDWIEPEWRIGT